MKLACELRPAGADVDKPTGFIKRKLRRWWRCEVTRWTRKDIMLEAVYCVRVSGHISPCNGFPRDDCFNQDYKDNKS